MRLVADECVDRAIVERLRRDGHDVVAIAERAPRATDDEVLALARVDGRPLLTEDKDFGALVFLQGRASAGVVLYRLPRASPPEQAARLADVVRRHGAELVGAFTVVGPRTVRIRPHAPPPGAEASG